jgi:glutaredoxin
MSSDSKFYIYSKPGCGFCDKLVEFMDSKHISYEKFTLDNDYSRQEFVIKFGHHASFPQVIHENKMIGGMKDTVRYLMERKHV